MRTKLPSVLIAVAWIAGVHQVAAQGARYFRIVGPTATTITAFQLDGTLVWTNSQPGATYVVQTVTALPGGTNWVDYVQLPVTQSVNTNQIVAYNPPPGMAFIPAGSFTMGDTLDGESDAVPTNIYVSAFYMDTNLVSYSQWQTVYAYATNHGYIFDNAGAGKAANQPVQAVNWYDCVTWCNARSQQAGKTPVYYTDAAMTKVYTNGKPSNPFTGEPAAAYPNWAASGYRLPTEAEWEKAARGGVSGQRFPWGDTISESQANYDGGTNDYSYDLGPNGYNSAFDIGIYPYTSPVGSFAANGYGLCDMAGNVDEWCWDWYGTPYGQPTTTNPTGPVGTVLPSSRVYRGGDWGHMAIYCRTANRSNKSFDEPTATDFGFRSVLPLGQ